MRDIYKQFHCWLPPFLAFICFWGSDLSRFFWFGTYSQIQDRKYTFKSCFFLLLTFSANLETVVLLVSLSLTLFASQPFSDEFYSFKNLLSTIHFGSLGPKGTQHDCSIYQDHLHAFYYFFLLLLFPKGPGVAVAFPYPDWTAASLFLSSFFLKHF